MGSMILPLQAYRLTLPKQPAPFSVYSFDGVERISEPYRFEINFTSVRSAIPVADVLGRSARFAFELADPFTGVLAIAARVFHGILSAFDELSQSDDQTLYKVVLEPRLKDFDLVRESRLFQNESGPAIIEAVLRHGGLTANDFRFELRHEYESREYTTQYDESSLAFIQRIMADEGIWFRFEQTDEHEVVVFGDDLDAYSREPSLAAPYRENAGFEAGAEAIKTLVERRTRVVKSIVVDDYNYRAASVPLIVEANAARDDVTTAGRQYRWGEHRATPGASTRVATLRHEAELADQVVFEGTGNVIGVTPGAVLRLTNRELAEARHGLLVTSVTHNASRKDAYLCAFNAMPADRVYRTKVDAAKRPRICGILPARIASPDNYKYAYLTPSGCYRVQMPFDLDSWSPGGTSRPVRLSKPYSGRDYGHHFPLIDGAEVAIIFTDGDPDRPVIIGALHDSQHPDLVNNENNTRNIIRTAGGNEMQMEDREGTEHAYLTTPFQTSQLTLGHMVDAKREKRGEGAELRTEGHVAVRGTKGVFISADGQAGMGQQLEMEAAKGRLEVALNQMAALAQNAELVKAHAAEVEKQRNFLEQRLEKLEAAVLLASAPGGIALTSGHHLQLAAQSNLIANAGANADIGVMKKFTLAAGEAISIIALKLGIKIFAARGKVEIQAQSDEMLLTALKDLKVTSVEGKVIISADKEVWIGAGGSYTRYTPEGIENGTKGDILEKCANWSKPAATSMRYPTPSFIQIPETRGFSQKFDLSQFLEGGAAATQAWAGVDYEIRNSEGKLLASGVTDEHAVTDRIFTANEEGVTAFIGGGSWNIHEELAADEDDDVEPEVSA